MGGCCSQNQESKELQSIQNEVRNMIRNIQLMKNPKVASHLLQKVMEYMYTKIKITYLSELINKMNSFNVKNVKHPGIEISPENQIQFCNNFLQKTNMMYEEIKKYRKDINSDLKKYQNVVKKLEVEINPSKDNNSRKSSERIDTHKLNAQFTKDEKRKMRMQAEIQKEQIEKNIYVDRKDDSLEKPLCNDFQQIQRDQDEFYYTMSSYRYSSGLRKRLDQQLQAQHPQKKNNEPTTETSSLNYYQQLQKKNKEIKQLLKTIQLLQDTFKKEKRTWMDEIKKLKLEKEEVVSTFIGNINRTSVYSDAMTEEASESFVQVKPSKNVQLVSNFIKENFPMPKNLQHKDTISSTNETNFVNRFEVIVKYFNHSSILPSFHSIEESAKMRKDLFKMFQSKISETKLLFAYNSVNTLNFNDYIGKGENIVVLVDMGNGTIIGGFAGLIDNEGYVNHSFLFSLRQGREGLKLKTKNKVNRINIDPTYIDFGNNQIKIRGSNLKFISNINGYQCHYFSQNKRISVESFLGTSDREHKIKSFEIHQIYFD